MSNFRRERMLMKQVITEQVKSTVTDTVFVREFNESDSNYHI